jgi:hypothetical protein
VSRRAALPGANELFRETSSAAALADRSAVAPESDTADPPPALKAVTRPPNAASGRQSRNAPGGPSGRERHDEKITVYLSADELVALDEAKAALYRDHGLKIDRGRIVREAVAVVVGDLGAKGEASILARRLREQ